MADGPVSPLRVTWYLVLVRFLYRRRHDNRTQQGRGGGGRWLWFDHEPLGCVPRAHGAQCAQGAVCAERGSGSSPLACVWGCRCGALGYGHCSAHTTYAVFVCVCVWSCSSVFVLDRIRIPLGLGARAWAWACCCCTSERRRGREPEPQPRVPGPPGCGLGQGGQGRKARAKNNHDHDHKG